MKRVLIIAYYWPPSAGSGVQRWLKFAKYLPENGWKPIVYTPENPDFSLQDQGLLKEIPEEVEVLKSIIWEPYQLGRILFKEKKESSNSVGIVSKKGGIKAYISNWVRGNIFIPDPKVYWRRSSVKFLTKYIKENGVDVIISTGTPHSMHLIAYDLKKTLGIPWIADFRDPWSELDMLKDYHILPFRMKKYERLERMVLKNADIALTTSEVWAKDFNRLGAKRAEVITNGYDKTDFTNEVIAYPNFVVSHFGLLNHLRNPKNLWNALNQLCNENEKFSNDLKIHLGGTIDPENLELISKYENLKDKVEVFPYLSHREVVKEYLKSSVLLLLLFNSESGIGNIPGKLFEYLAAKKSVLAFGPGKGDSEKIIRETESGCYFEYNSDVESIKEGILSLFNQYLSESSSSDSKVDEYSRSSLTQKLANLLNELSV